MGRALTPGLTLFLLYHAVSSHVLANSLRQWFSTLSMHPSVSPAGLIETDDWAPASEFPIQQI